MAAGWPDRLWLGKKGPLTASGIARPSWFGRRLGAELAAAERERRHLQPFNDAFPDLDLDTAYPAQSLR